MSKEVVKKLPFILQTILIAVVLTNVIYAVTVRSSSISTQTEAATLTVLSGVEVENYSPAQEVTRKPYEPIKPRDPRAIRLERFLNIQQSELAEHADLIVALGDKYGVDYKIPVAISGSESGYCFKAYFANNCWGYGRFAWGTLEEGIRSYMSKMNVGYFQKGRKTIETIAPVYNTVNTQEFIEKVTYHYNLIP